MSETLKIQVEDAEFLAKSNLCSSEAELGDRRVAEVRRGGGRGFLTKKREPGNSAASICGGNKNLFEISIS